MALIYKYRLKQKLSDLLNKKCILRLTFNCDQGESQIDLFVNDEYLDLFPLQDSLEFSIIQDLNLSFEGYHFISGKGFFELIDNNIFLNYDLEEIDFNPVNFEHIVIDREKYVKENTKYLKGKILYLSSKYDTEPHTSEIV